MTGAEVNEFTKRTHGPKDRDLLVSPRTQIRPEEGYTYSKRDTKL